jgi:hypothetical protein
MKAHIFYELGQFRKIGPVLSRALKLQERRVEQSNEKTLDIARSLLQYYSQTGKFENAEELKRKYFTDAMANQKDENNVKN